MASARKRHSQTCTISNKKIKVLHPRNDDDPQQIPVPSYVDEVADQVFGNDDLISRIASYLGVRDLYNFTYTSKSQMQRLTYDTVVCVAMLSGGHAKTTTEKLVDLIRTRKIWTPSPLRILRLINGKRCEMCNQNKSTTVSKQFGVLFCTKACIRIGTRAGKGGDTKAITNNQKWAPFIEHERITSVTSRNLGVSLSWVFTVPVRDACGDPCGPLVTREQMQRIITQSQSSDDDDNDTNHRTKIQLNKLFDELDLLDTNAKHVESIQQAFESIREKAVTRKREKLNEKKEATSNFNQIRKKKTLDMLGALCNLMGDVPPRWTETVMSFQFEAKGSCSREVALFRSELVADQLNALARAPSKANKHKLKEVASILKGRFNLIQSTGFRDFSFLKELSDPFTQILWEHLHNRNDIDAYQLCNKEALEFIGQGKLINALHVLLPLEVRDAAVSAMTIVSQPKSSNFALRYWQFLDPSKLNPSTVHQCQKYMDLCPTLYQQAVDQGLEDDPFKFLDQSCIRLILGM